MLRATQNNTMTILKPCTTTSTASDEDQRVVISRSPPCPSARSPQRALTLVRHVIPEEEIYEANVSDDDKTVLASSSQGALQCASGGSSCFYGRNAAKQMGGDRLLMHAPLAAKHRVPLMCLGVFVVLCVMAMGFAVEYATVGSKNGAIQGPGNQVGVCAHMHLST